MAWPTVAVNTTNLDANADSPLSARPDILDLTTKFNDLIAMRGVANGVASLSGSGKVPSAQIGYANSLDVGVVVGMGAGTIDVQHGIYFDSTHPYVPIAKAAHTFTSVTGSGGTASTTISNPMGTDDVFMFLMGLASGYPHFVACMKRPDGQAAVLRGEGAGSMEFVTVSAPSTGNLALSVKNAYSSAQNITIYYMLAKLAYF